MPGESRKWIAAAPVSQQRQRGYCRKRETLIIDPICIDGEEYNAIRG